MSVAFFGPLCASKFALETLADSLRLELHRFGIDVVKVHPGTIATPAVEKARHDAESTLASLPAAARGQYGEALRRWLEIFSREAASGATPAKVAEAVHTALTAERPKGLYTGDWSTAAMESFFGLAPQGLLDWARRRMQHLD